MLFFTHNRTGLNDKQALNIFLQSKIRYGEILQLLSLDTLWPQIHLFSAADSCGGILSIPFETLTAVDKYPKL